MASIFDRAPDRRGTNSIKWTRYEADVLPLWVADMDFPAPEPAREALQAALRHGVLGYEMPSRNLKETVAARMHRLYKWDVSPDSVVATPGIVAGFMAAARAVCPNGGGVLVQPPVYPPFLETPKNTGATGQLAPLRPTDSAVSLGYEIDWEALEAGFDSNGVPTRMFLLCHPHNPIGRSFTAAELERIGDLCDRRDAVICSDEIHSELLLGGASHAPMAAVSREIEARTITLVSPSKTFNLVGLACGFAIVPDPALRSRYGRVLQQLALHVNSLGLIAAEVAFSGACDGWLGELRSYLTDNRDYLVGFVAEHLPGVSVTCPDATYLAWMDFGELARAGRLKPDPCRFLLRKARVALNAGPEFGPGGEHCVRLNFGCARSILIEALQRIRVALG